MSDGIRWHEMTTTEISDRFRRQMVEANRWRTAAHLLAYEMSKTSVDRTMDQILDEAYRQAVTGE